MYGVPWLARDPRSPIHVQTCVLRGSLKAVYAQSWSYWPSGWASLSGSRVLSCHFNDSIFRLFLWASFWEKNWGFISSYIISHVQLLESPRLFLTPDSLHSETPRSAAGQMDLLPSMSPFIFTCIRCFLTLMALPLFTSDLDRVLGLWIYFRTFNNQLSFLFSFLSWF